MHRYKLARLIGIGISLFFVALSPTLYTQAAQTTLTASLIFMAATKDESNFHPRMSLVKVDPDTLQMETFYEDPTTIENGLYPLRWSPDGEYLLFIRIEQLKPGGDFSPANYKVQLCTLTKMGILARCFDRPPEVNLFRGKLFQQIGTATWSSDSKSVFYATTLNDVLQLIEANAESGKQKQLIYQTPIISVFSGDALYLSWTPDLAIIASGFSVAFNPKKIQPELIYRDIGDGKLQHASLPIFDTLEDPYICLNFSPRGTYIAILARNPRRRPDSEIYQDLYLLDTQLKVVHKLGETDEDERLSHQCPTWQPDEQAFVFTAHKPGGPPPISGLFRYSLADRGLISLYEFPSEAGLTMFGDYMAISPDGEYIAGVSHDVPANGTQVKVLFPDGEVRAFLGNYLFTRFPVWGN